MTAYRNERNRKKLLIPVVALVLCAAAMIGLGYAALTSTVTNQANVVAGDGLSANLVDSEGDPLTGQDFANDEDVIHYGTSTIDEVTTYYVSADSEIKLGGAILEVEALTTSGVANVTQVDVWYEITWSSGSAPYGMTTSLDIGGQTISAGEANGTTTPLALSGATEFAVVLKGAIPELPANYGLEDEPVIPTYSITFYVVPVA